MYYFFLNISKSFQYHGVDLQKGANRNKQLYDGVLSALCNAIITKENMKLIDG